MAAGGRARWALACLTQLAGAAVVLDQDPEVTGSSHSLRGERVVGLFAEAGYERVPVEDFLDRELLLVFRPRPHHR